MGAPWGELLSWVQRGIRSGHLIPRISLRSTAHQRKTTGWLVGRVIPEWSHRTGQTRPMIVSPIERYCSGDKQNRFRSCILSGLYVRSTRNTIALNRDRLLVLKHPSTYANNPPTENPCGSTPASPHTNPSPTTDQPNTTPSTTAQRARNRSSHPPA